MNASVVQATAISINFLSNSAHNGGLVHPIGANTAGVIPVGNWNDVAWRPTGTTLKDSNGATVSGLTLATPNYSEASTVWGATLGTNSNFAGQPGNTALFRDHVFRGNANPIDLVFTGDVPYAVFDIYIYYNSHTVINRGQTFSLYNGGTLLATRVGYQLTTKVETGFVESNYQPLLANANDANYVVFRGIKRSDLTAATFTIRAQGMGSISSPSPFGYINALQFVQIVPEPGAAPLLLLSGSLVYLLRCVHSRRAERG